MTTSIVLTMIGEDEPGLVEAVARTVAAHQGNWLESSMSHMAGKVAGIARVEVPDSETGALSDALAKLGARGLRVAVESCASIEAGKSLPLAHLELVGSDHPGIVHDISKVLTRCQVNIEELNTEIVGAPMSGEPLFRATAQLRLPTGLTQQDLERELEKVAESLMVEVRLGDAD